MEKSVTVPEGYMKNSAGHLVPLDLIDKQEIDMNTIVLAMFGKAKALNSQMVGFKADALTELDQYFKKSAKRSKADMPERLPTGKLFSFDRKVMIEVQRAVKMEYDHRANEAQAILAEVVSELGEQTPPLVREIMNQLLQLGEGGTVKAGSITQLRKLRTKDKRIGAAVDLLAKAGTQVERGRYIRIYEQNSVTGSYDPVSLDLASL